MTPSSLKFVVLDIETTGLEADKDQIIEVAIIKIINNQITDRFESLVKIKFGEIPKMITHLTGIKNEDLIHAPPITDLKNKIVEFVGDLPIMGHNIQFDLEFLAANDIKLNNPRFDSFELSAIVLPKQESCSLETLAKIYQVEHRDSHRAMADIMANFEVWQELFKILQSTPSKTLKQLITIASKTNWSLKSVFQVALDNPIPNNPKPSIATNDIPNSSLAISSLNQLFKDPRGLPNTLENYRFRDSQLQLSEEILANFKEKKSLIAEAPAGIGKSLAYLSAAIFNQESVLIATSTKQLQDQLINHDIPLLKKIFPELKSHHLKGRNNYLCRKRLVNFLAKEKFSDSEALLLAKVVYWVDQTETGDLSEMNLYREDFLLFAEYLSAEGSPYYEGSFLEQARNQAHSADIVIINQHLLAQNALLGEKFLPNSPILVIDEAHQLEQTLSNSLDRRITWYQVENKLKAIKNHLEAIQSVRLNLDLKNVIQDTSKFYELFGPYATIWVLMARDHVNPDSYLTKVLLEDKIMSQPDYGNILESTREISNKWHNLGQNISQSIDESNWGLEIKIKIQEINDWFNELTDLIQGVDQENFIYYFEFDQEGNFSLHYIPRELGNFFQEKIMQPRSSTILLSATLSDFYGFETKTETSFHYLRTLLKIPPETNELVLDSPFDLEKQMQVLVIKDLPSPQAVGNFQRTSVVLFDLIRILKGRILGLFTSYRALETFFDNLAPQFKSQGINILGQRFSGGLGKITHAYQHDPNNSIIFGVKTFWEGIDFRKNPFKAIFIHRLPFDHLNDPIIKLRLKNFPDPFNDYSIPRALIRFKQGVGRLIRHEDQHGLIILLDSRLHQKNYGKKFLKIFPKKIIKFINANELVENLEQWKQKESPKP